jgi:hypothetical protein
VEKPSEKVSEESWTYPCWAPKQCFLAHLHHCVPAKYKGRNVDRSLFGHFQMWHSANFGRSGLSKVGNPRRRSFFSWRTTRTGQ